MPITQKNDITAAKKIEHITSSKLDVESDN